MKKEKKQAPEEKKVNTEETAAQAETADEAAEQETPAQAESAQTKEETLEAAAKAAAQQMMEALKTADEALKSAKEAEQKAEQWQDQALRLQAEFDNFRKRSAAEKDAAVEQGESLTLTALLPVIDNLERAVASVGGAAEDPIVKGVQMWKRSRRKEKNLTPTSITPSCRRKRTTKRKRISSPRSCKTDTFTRARSSAMPR